MGVDTKIADICSKSSFANSAAFSIFYRDPYTVVQIPNISMIIVSFFLFGMQVYVERRVRNSVKCSIKGPWYSLMSIATVFWK